jgi:hypothetical protein
LQSTAEELNISSRLEGVRKGVRNAGQQAIEDALRLRVQAERKVETAREQLRLGGINAADKFGDKELALLAPIAQHVVWVDLARSQITDAAADTLEERIDELTENERVITAQVVALENLRLEIEAMLSQDMIEPEVERQGFDVSL